jgi:hypothetical protein
MCVCVCVCDWGAVGGSGWVSVEKIYIALWFVSTSRKLNDL